MSRKTKKIEKPLVDIIGLFAKQKDSFVGDLMYDGRISVFTITDTDQKTFIAEKLGKVLSNKRKSLNLTLELKEVDSIELCIFQHNAKADMLKETYSLKEVRLALPELNNLLLLLSEKKLLERNIISLVKQNISLIQVLKDFEKDIYLLSETDIKELKYMSQTEPFTRRQILYTYDYYMSMYDDSAHMIDDGGQRKEAEKQNTHIKPFIDILSKVINLYGLSKN